MPPSHQPLRPIWTEDQFISKQVRALGMKLDHAMWCSYESAFNSWRTFADHHSFPIFPSVITLSNYVLYMSDFIKPDSVATYLAGIIHYLSPIYPDIQDIHNSSLVKDCLTGCCCLNNKPIIQKQPLPLNLIQSAVSTLPKSYDNLLFKTMLSVGFHALLWLGDLCYLDILYLQNPAKIAK